MSQQMPQAPPSEDTTSNFLEYRHEPRPVDPKSTRPLLADPELRKLLTKEALRLNDRYLQELIEAHNFCPYAKMARLQGRMKRYVFLDPILPLDGILDLLDTIADDPKQEVVQVIFPLLEVQPVLWRNFTKSIDDFHAARHPKRSAPMASAAFHPAAPFLKESAAALVPLFRRAPDPTIQWTRLSVLRKISEGQTGQQSHYLDTRGLDLDQLLAMLGEVRPSLSEKIAAANEKHLKTLGLENIVARFNEIAEDRRLAYAKIMKNHDAKHESPPRTL